jgi:hypothetical protein
MSIGLSLQSSFSLGPALTSIRHMESSSMGAILTGVE